MEEAQKNVDKLQAKVDATEARFLVEKAGKEARDLQEATTAALAEFDTRSAERKTEFD
jgi:hypothetical protein